ncbi:hypothetical protein E2C01_043785 [Portunus trituberculatus]|uniref:Uncharacterized protein n=1 Tax=Portunus trituberculatus TaxID=210409 RepID=A0A5B7FXN1_PORTR|nr:hypothetical protein [Portunus trituberculatus]
MKQNNSFSCCFSDVMKCKIKFKSSHDVWRNLKSAFYFSLGIFQVCPCQSTLKKKKIEISPV